MFIVVVAKKKGQFTIYCKIRRANNHLILYFFLQGTGIIGKGKLNVTFNEAAKALILPFVLVSFHFKAKTSTKNRRKPNRAKRRLRVQKTSLLWNM